MPRIAVMASTGPVRSRPRITKVENTYIMPPEAAVAMAAVEVSRTTGLRFMVRVNLTGSRRSIAQYLYFIRQSLKFVRVDTVDAVVGLLDGVRARGAFTLRMMMDPPWSMSIRDEAPLTVICQTHGRAAIVAEGGATSWLSPGDLALTRGSERYVYADDPA